MVICYDTQKDDLMWGNTFKLINYLSKFDFKHPEKQTTYYIGIFITDNQDN
jgi:hypothetical protein